MKDSGCGFLIGDEVLISSKGSCTGMTGKITGKWEQIGYDNCWKVKVENHNKNITICVREDNISKIDLSMEGNNMAKLTGFSKVAIIKQGYKNYYFAIYDDGTDYSVGDKVLVSGNSQIQVIDEFVSVEKATFEFGGNITAEIICKIDTTAYDERLARRQQAEQIKKDMDRIIKKMDEVNKYEMYANQNPELKKMLDAYKKLV